MLSISSIFSAISGNVGALRKAPDTNVPGNSIAKHAEAVDDVVSLSSQGIKAAGRAQPELSSRPPKLNNSSPTAKEPGASTKSDKDPPIIDQLQQTDRAVRAHEQAHIAAGGGLVRSSATFSYQRGPDGKQYAVGGEVSINTLPEGTPEKSIEKARTIRAAALAPADPSPQDRAVAAQAARIEAEAHQQIATQQGESAQSTTNAKASSQQSDSHTESTPSPEVKRGITAYQENRDMFSLVVQTSSFRISA